MRLLIFTFSLALACRTQHPTEEVGISPDSSVTSLWGKTYENIPLIVVEDSGLNLAAVSETPTSPEQSIIIRRLSKPPKSFMGGWSEVAQAFRGRVIEAGDQISTEGLSRPLS